MSVREITALRDFDLESQVATLYSPELAYHNFQHALDTIDAAHNITLKCLDEGIRVDTQVVYYALLFHDAGFRADHLALGFGSKEAYSADLAVNWLGERGVSNRMIEKVAAAVLSTHRGASFITTEQKAVRAADLSGLAAGYNVFLENSANLKLEYELFQCATLDWPAWVANVRETVNFYLSQEIRLTSYFSNADGESAFHQAVRRNLERLVAEAAI
jgi:predicted metal-dependent HD superfamily phosphohydrolase